jgi:hypothetical protein
MRLFWIAFVVLLLQGCTLLPAEHHQEKMNYYPVSLNDDALQYRHISGGTTIEIKGTNAVVHPEGTGSMHPFFGERSTLVMQKLQPGDELNVGDIICYSDGNWSALHQLIKEENGCFTAKGVNTDRIDPVCVTRDMASWRLVGVVFTESGGGGYRE